MKKTEVTKLDQEMEQKRKSAAAEMPASAAAMSNKLQYFEGEVRRLESQLTQQKVSYERQIA